MDNGRCWLVAGLGNPGEAYRDSRHNVGFMVMDLLAKVHGLPPFSPYPGAEAAWTAGTLHGCSVILAKPLTYMNRSGPALQRLVEEQGIYEGSLLIVHDDMDLTFGRIKIKEKGGHGGHKGILSLIGAFGRDDILRVRIGIGRPPPGISPTDHVLGTFEPQERVQLGPVLDRALEAVVAVICEGTGAAMNRFNSREGQTHQSHS
jgi:PTH1 family peptidyl-tRNA hydrolase